jgi:AraC-like DNA-binding protein
VVGWFSLNQPPVAVEPDPPPAPAPERADAAPDDARADAVEARLAELMDGSAPLYLEPALTIGEVARRSGYPEYLVSTVINRRSGGTFWDYINRLRVEAARACLADAGDTRTILDIAYACGFTSKSTFNAAFKRQVGETPSGYRKAAQMRPLTAADGGAGRR